jgi:hypothetical protein
MGFEGQSDMRPTDPLYPSYKDRLYEISRISLAADAIAATMPA